LVYDFYVIYNVFRVPNPAHWRLFSVFTALGLLTQRQKKILCGSGRLGHTQATLGEGVTEMASFDRTLTISY